jgi:3-phosphoshikimate 1-carboxyvinyltransferase
MTTRFAPAGPLRGEVAAPPDKSLSHRAALLGAMSSTPVRVTNHLDAEDTNSTLAAVRALGADVEAGSDGLVIRGPGLRGAGASGRSATSEPVPDRGVIDVGNAGTLMRLLPGWLAGQDGGAWTLDGDASIRRRPVDRIAAPLTAMGAELEAREDRFPPFTVRGRPLRGIDYRLPMASAQVKSCVLLAGLLAAGATTVIEPKPSRDHTERLLLRAGARLERSGDRVTVHPAYELRLDHIHVPGDPSSAAFHIAAAALVPGSRIRVTDVGLNWTRTGFLQILRRMGGRVEGELEAPPPGPFRSDESSVDPETGPLRPDEPVGGLEIAHAPLTATIVEPDEVPLAIDELPLVALLGCFAEGETVVRGAEELRVKESDRIASVVEGLRALGAAIEATEDGFAVTGTGGLRGGVLRADGDHRLAMLGAVAGLASDDGVEVVGMEAAAVSYPGFSADLATLL